MSVLQAETVRGPAALDLTQRALPEGFDAWLSALPSDLWPDGRFLCDVADVRAALQTLFAECVTPDDAFSRWWINDVAALAERFAALSREPIVDVRLELITTDACRRFHIDSVRLRLVTTFYGPGTQLVPQDRGAEARRDQERYDGPVERLSPGDIAIFRGGPQGVVHRSPPIEANSGRRAVLCVNQPSSVSPPLWVPNHRAVDADQTEQDAVA